MMHDSEPQQPIAQPVDLAQPINASERMESVDVIRGVALLGILILNIQSFAMPGAAYINPTAYGDLTGANYWVWYFTHVLGDQKFMSIFSMLFGAGIIVMTSRAEARGASAAALHYRRMGWLLLFGLLHGYLVWYGDILYTYAMCGLAAFLFRKWPPVLLLILGLIVVAIGSAISIGLGYSMPHWGEQGVAGFQQGWEPQTEAIQQELDAYRGSYAEQFAFRFPETLLFQTMLFVLMMSWRAGGLMLIGMALLRWGVFSAARSRRFYLISAILCLAFGLPVIMYGVHRNELSGWDVNYSFFLGGQYNYWGSLLVSMAWISIAMVLFKSKPGMMRPLAFVGQMAFTNYIMQSLICTTVFYGHGLGLFGSVDRTQQFAIVVGVWIFQFVFSTVWLRSFRLGPLEWVWRSLTYLRIQPLRHDRQFRRRFAYDAANGSPRNAN